MRWAFREQLGRLALPACAPPPVTSQRWVWRTLRARARAMPIFLGVLAAGAAVVAGGAAGNEPLQKARRAPPHLRARAAFAISKCFRGLCSAVRAQEWDKWMKKDHKELTGPAQGVATAPLRKPVAGGRPLWMDDSVKPEEVDPRLADAMVFRPELDGKERKATHWTLNDKGDEEPSHGDGGA